MDTGFIKGKLETNSCVTKEKKHFMKNEQLCSKLKDHIFFRRKESIDFLKAGRLCSESKAFIIINLFAILIGRGKKLLLDLKCLVLGIWKQEFEQRVFCGFESFIKVNSTSTVLCQTFQR